MPKVNDLEKEFLSTIIETKTKSTRKKSINAKKKGNNGELELVHILNERFGDRTFARSVSSGAYTGGMNRSRADSLTEEQALVFSGDIRVPKNFKFTIEHKSYANFDFWWLFGEKSTLFSWYAQSESDAEAVNKKPLLVVKINNHKRICFVNLEDIPKGANIIFAHNGKGCFNLEDFLNLKDEYFFEA